MTRKLVEDRLTVEIAEVVVSEFRRECGLLAGQNLESGLVKEGKFGVGRDVEPSVPTPYLNVEQAASYLRKTKKAVYGLVERGRLKKLEGSRILLFTKAMLDD